MRIIKAIWCAPLTLMGFAWALILGAVFLRYDPIDTSFHWALPPGGRGQWWFKKFSIGAQTVGASVVYGEPRWSTVESMVAHEKCHVAQNLRFGPFAPVLYGMSMLVAWAYNQDSYRGSDAEEEARFTSGESTKPEELKPNGKWL